MFESGIDWMRLKFRRFFPTWRRLSKSPAPSTLSCQPWLDLKPVWNIIFVGYKHIGRQSKEYLFIVWLTGERPRWWRIAEVDHCPNKVMGVWKEGDRYLFCRHRCSFFFPRSSTCPLSEGWVPAGCLESQDSQTIACLTLCSAKLFK